MEYLDFFPFTVVRPSSSLATSFCQTPKEIKESTWQIGEEVSYNKELSLREAELGEELC